MRKKDKIEKYIDKVLKDFSINGAEVCEASKSRYYNVNGRILRVSDHIGSGSSGNMSVIIPSFNGFGNNDNYIIHAHTEGSISVVNYEQAKKIVFSFIACSSFMAEITQKCTNLQIDKKDVGKTCGSTELNASMSILKKRLTASQFKQLKNFLKQK